jgi:hypothetical protein
LKYSVYTATFARPDDGVFAGQRSSEYPIQRSMAAAPGATVRSTQA